MSNTKTRADDAASSAPDGGQPLLEVNGLKKHFSQSGGILDRLLSKGSDTVHAVDGVDLTIREGETLAVVGESGCGKTTLARTIVNLYDATEGEVYLDGDQISGLSAREMRPYRRRIQMIFQDPLASLNPRKTVGQILTTPMKVHSIGDNSKDRLRRAEELLETVGLKPEHVDRYPHQFSGGQQQRIGVARALGLDPDILVADEPVSALDVSVQAQILNLLRELRDEMDLALMFIAHDLSTVRYLSDRVAVMYLGEVVETGPTEELFEDPQHPYTRSLLSAIPRINPDKRSDRIPLSGSVPSPIDPPSGCRFHTRCPEVIPPEEWDVAQEEFVPLLEFKNRVLNKEFDLETIEARVDALEDARVETISDYLVMESFEGDVDALPPEASESIYEVASLIEQDDIDGAATTIADTMVSPCETDAPAAYELGDLRWGKCHRLSADHGN